MAPVDRNILLAKLHHNTGLSTITMTARLGVKPRSRNGGRGGGKGRKRERSLFEIMEEIERKESSDHLGGESDAAAEPSAKAEKAQAAAAAAAAKAAAATAAAEASNQQNQADAEAEKRAAREKVTASLLTAERINRLMREHSDDCALTVVNLPLKTRMQPEHFVDYVSVLSRYSLLSTARAKPELESILKLSPKTHHLPLPTTNSTAKGIDRMLLVRGSGKEVVTSFA